MILSLNQFLAIDKCLLPTFFVVYVYLKIAVINQLDLSMISLYANTH